MFKVAIPFVDGANILKVVAKNEAMEAVYFYKTNFQLVPKKLKEANFTSLNVMLGSNRYFEDKIAQVYWIPEQPYSEGSWRYIGGKPFKTKTRYGELPASELDILNTTQDPIFKHNATELRFLKRMFWTSNMRFIFIGHILFRWFKKKHWLII